MQGQALTYTSDGFSLENSSSNFVQTTATTGSTWTPASNTVYVSSAWFEPCTTHHYVYSYPWSYQGTRRVPMKLSHLEHIRELCKTDKKLRKAMRSIAPYIEVEIDF